MIWEKKEIDAVKVKEFAEAYGMETVTAAVLVRRGILEPEDVMFFLEEDFRCLHNPFLFKDMEKAVDRIGKAVSGGEKILIYGDRDVDGITATVLLYESLADLSGDVIWRVPLGDDDYGLSRKDVEEAAALGVTLLCTVDCGISNLKEIDFARDLGIDVIVVDHHNPQGGLPSACAVINPKVSGCGYPFVQLSGCGVASKLDWALAFARGPFYKKSVLLLQITPQNDTFTVEAVRLVNLAKTDGFRENVVPALGKKVFEKFTAFASGSEIVVHALAEQEKMFEKAFGPEAGAIKLVDFQPLLGSAFPQLAGKSLLAIKELSRLQKFEGKIQTEIDIFKNLYVSAALKSLKDHFSRVHRRMDLAALGTIADLMPLVNENRIIVRQGLRLIAENGRKGLREILSRKNLLGREISVKDVAWQISPVINATGRLGEPDKAVDLLLSVDREKLESLSVYINKLNEKRKELGDIAWNKMYQAAQESYDASDGKFVLVSGASVHRGVTGIIATKMVRHFKTPACVVAELKDKAVGSVRSVPRFPLTAFLAHFKDVFSDYGGHDLAAGFNLPLERLGSFRKRFYEVVRSLVLPEEQEDRILIDAEIPKNMLTPELYRTVSLLAPYGEANPSLSLYTKDLLVAACDVVGKKEQVHLKMLLDTGTFKFPSMLWNGVDLYGGRFKTGERVDIIYRMNKNVFMNTETLQLIVSDIARAGEHDVRILRPDEDFFDSSRRTDY
ncbi:MAG: single-stranded-DNA-specific exonuclease RecJ [Spirochaetales bacterium]|nr:single-stranded-DNA-specific exonuclease RecJ [Spirochaetales bacterium]